MVKKKKCFDGKCADEKKDVSQSVCMFDIQCGQKTGSLYANVPVIYIYIYIYIYIDR